MPDMITLEQRLEDMSRHEDHACVERERVKGKLVMVEVRSSNKVAEPQFFFSSPLQSHRADFFEKASQDFQNALV